MQEERGGLHLSQPNMKSPQGNPRRRPILEAEKTPAVLTRREIQPLFLVCVEINSSEEFVTTLVMGVGELLGVATFIMLANSSEL
jgi:hypothetical protein